MNIAQGLAGDQVELTEAKYSDSMGVYCRFGNYPVDTMELQYYGALYVTHGKPDQRSTTDPYKYNSYDAPRTPVAFEVWPGRHVSYDELSKNMMLPVEIIKAAYEQVITPHRKQLAGQWTVSDK